jgi:hypothetical protein
MDDGAYQKTAVFACELRDDLGFESPLLCIADELRRLASLGGYQLRTIFALRDPVYGADEVAARGYIALPAPVIRQTLEINSAAKSYANLVATIGFAHERELTLLLQAWDRLFGLLDASLLVVDNSPSACMAARGRIPVVVTGSGFGAPPPDIAVFPALTSDAQTETNQSMILDIVNRVLHSRGVQSISNLPELFAGDQRAVFTVPQLDPYHAQRQENLYSPCLRPSNPSAARQGPSIFLALPSVFANLTGIVRVLQRIGVPISCYVPGPETVGLTLLRQAGARVFDKRPLVHEALSDAAVVLSASSDLALAAYIAGRPQAVLRADPEITAMASELERRRVAIALNITDVDKLAGAIRELLNNPSYTHSAREEARRLKIASTESNSVAYAARECLQLLRLEPRHCC